MLIKKIIIKAIISSIISIFLGLEIEGANSDSSGVSFVKQFFSSSLMTR
jgi:hypothetical protein